MGESNKMVKLLDIVQAKQVLFKEKKKPTKKPKDSTSAQLKPIEREYELEQIKCWGMKVWKAESDYEQPIMKDIKIND